MNDYISKTILRERAACCPSISPAENSVLWHVVPATGLSFKQQELTSGAGAVNSQTIHGSCFSSIRKSLWRFLVHFSASSLGHSLWTGPAGSLTEIPLERH